MLQTARRSTKKMDEEMNGSAKSPAEHSANRPIQKCYASAVHRENTVANSKTHQSDVKARQCLLSDFKQCS